MIMFMAKIQGELPGLALLHNTCHCLLLQVNRINLQSISSHPESSQSLTSLEKSLMLKESPKHMPHLFVGTYKAEKSSFSQHVWTLCNRNESAVLKLLSLKKPLQLKPTIIALQRSIEVLLLQCLVKLAQFYFSGWVTWYLRAATLTKKLFFLLKLLFLLGSLNKICTI